MTEHVAMSDGVLAELRRWAERDHASDEEAFSHGSRGRPVFPTPARRQLMLLAEVDRLRNQQPHAGVVRDRDELAAEVERLRELLDSIWLYVEWRWVTRQLTTDQKNLWADAVDTTSMARQVEDGEEPRPVAVRWWHEDFVEGQE